MSATTSTALLYRTYNSLFLSLPFQGIEEAGTHLALFAQYCKNGFDAGKRPDQIVEGFWEEYFEHTPPRERHDLLFYFIQYVERQVVLFDSVEDALFHQTHEMDGPGSLKHLLTRLDSDPLRALLLEKIRQYSVRVVLTAHPTQFYPGKVLGIINDLGHQIRGNHLAEIQLLLKQLGKTTFVNRAKPMPIDEAISLGWYLENVLFHTLPDILFRLLRALGQDVTTFDNPRLLALGFWPGGDRDGNPFVTADTTLEVAQRLREGTLRGYYREIRILRRRLTFRGTEECIIEAEEKIYNTLYHPHREKRYHSCQQLLDDLTEARKILIDQHDSLFLDDLDQYILKVRVFGFYFASLDIRQDSRKHTEVWRAILQNRQAESLSAPPFDYDAASEAERMDFLLNTPIRLDENDFTDPFVKETIRSFRIIGDIQRDNGELGCHRYIISNCQNAGNVAEVLALAQLTFRHSSARKGGEPVNIPLDVVPLFETIDDLADCGAVMERLYNHPHYARHLAARGKVQTIMLGFSDGTKDGGYLRANWSIYRAKEELSRVSRVHGVTAVFFDGRGGPPGRGGGNNASYYASQGQDIENQGIQVTIQGQTVSSTYGTRAAAAFNIERLLTAGLENQLFYSPARALTAADYQLLDDLADTAYQSYLKLKNHPDFVPYLEKITPLKWYGDSNIASRPTKRSGDAALRFEDLRAIPFVGAWAQMKQNVPGYYGVGSAISAFRSGRRAELDALYQHSLFFRTLLENSMQSLSKSNFEATQYLADHPEFGDFWKMLHDEYLLTKETLQDLSGQSKLLSGNDMSRSSIALREQIVLPLIAIQQYALQKLQDEGLPEADAAFYRKLVLRAMFGIINAARNAA